MVDEMLTRSARRIGDRPLRLALGADEQHLATGGRRGRDEVERAREERHGLRQVENVDAVARAEDIRLHARIPTVGLVTEVRSEERSVGKECVRTCRTRWGRLL